MIKIGDFAKLFDVSLKTIRFYEEKGLLHPVYVDIYTGYRYYDEENVKEMSKILYLKNLGLELSEIKNFNENTIQDKIDEYINKLGEIRNNISTLETLKERGFSKVLDFVNDEQVIGKWVLKAVVKNKEDYKKGNFVESDYRIKEMYLLPNGEKYWIISWTKGYIYFKDVANPYEIDNVSGLMYLGIVDNITKEIEITCVYEKVNDKKYTLDDICKKDDTNIPFISDNNIIGMWEYVDYVFKKENFNPSVKFWKGNTFLENMAFLPNGEAIVKFKMENEDVKTYPLKYTKDYIFDVCMDDTSSKYEIKTIDGKEYMFLEWKSGDYVFGHLEPNYYVLRKIN